MSTVNNPRVTITAGLLLAFLALPRQLNAQPTPTCEDIPDCWQHFQLGLRYADLHKSADALQEFQTAYTHSPQPRILANIGRSLFHLGRMSEAAEIYKTASELAGKDSELKTLIDRFMLETNTLGRHAPNDAPKGRSRPTRRQPSADDLWRQKVPIYFRSTAVSPNISYINNNNNANNNNLSISHSRSWLWPVLGVLAGGITVAAVGGALAASQGSSEPEHGLPIHVVSF